MICCRSILSFVWRFTLRPLIKFKEMSTARLDELSSLREGAKDGGTRQKLKVFIIFSGKSLFVVSFCGITSLDVKIKRKNRPIMRFVIRFISVANCNPAPYALEGEANLKPKSLIHEAELLRAQARLLRAQARDHWVYIIEKIEDEAL
jgi:hypothetical protein